MGVCACLTQGHCPHSVTVASFVDNDSSMSSLWAIPLWLLQIPKGRTWVRICHSQNLLQLQVLQQFCSGALLNYRCWTGNREVVGGERFFSCTIRIKPEQTKTRKVSVPAPCPWLILWVLPLLILIYLSCCYMGLLTWEFFPIRK